MKKWFSLNSPSSAIALLSFTILAGATALQAIPPAPEPSVALSPIMPAYREIPVSEFLTQRQLVRQDPHTVALSLFSEFLQESEGRRSEQLAIEYPTWNTAVATVTIIGLADDSMKALRYRLKFQQTEGEWQLTDVGSQSQCQQGRGHQHWSDELCS